MALYKWQEECLQAWKNNGCHGIANVITGAGKTVLALACADYLRSQHAHLRIKIVVPTVYLASQWRENVLSYFADSSQPFSSEDIGLVGDARQDDPALPVVIYVINSARDTLAGHICRDVLDRNKVLLIADECHHYGSRHNRRIFSYAPLLSRLEGHSYDAASTVFTLGLSATPYCQHYETVLVPSLGKEIYHYSFHQALAGKRIAPFRILQIAVPFTSEEMMKYADLSEALIRLKSFLLKDYPYLKGLQSTPAFFPELNKLAQAEDGEGSASAYLNTIYARRRLTQMAEARKKCVASLLERLDRHVPVLLFCERIEQADELYAYLQLAMPDQVSRYHSAMDKKSRQLSLEEFRTHRSQVLVTCKALDEGIDVPEAAVGIVVSSTLTTRQRIQRMGRIIRKTGEQKLALLYYLYVNYSADEPAYLPDQPDTVIANLRYLADEDDFQCDAYISCAIRVLDRARQVGLSAEKLAELRLMIEMGLTKADWLLGEEEYVQHIRSACDQQSKNYWIVMQQISRQVTG